MSDAEIQLRKHLERVRDNLFFANESYRLYMTIKENDRNKIKNLDIGDLLEPLPRLLINDIIIKLSKIIEETSGINLKKLIASKTIEISILNNSTFAHRKS